VIIRLNHLVHTFYQDIEQTNFSHLPEWFSMLSKLELEHEHEHHNGLLTMELLFLFLH
jgi:hypothetical protein